jgi:hypothetical protein
VVKVVGMVNAVPEFAGHGKVIDGCSDLLVAVLGENGRHARASVGMGSLPGQLTVEIEAVCPGHVVSRRQQKRPQRLALGQRLPGGDRDQRRVRRSKGRLGPGRPGFAI